MAKGVRPQTFFLNETHELTPKERGGGGPLPQYVGISWAAKAKAINKSLHTVAGQVQSSHDPLKDERYFVIVLPEPDVEKSSKNKKRYPTGKYKEKTEFDDVHGKVFDRLGLDLLQVTDDGKAVVHADKEKFDQLVQRSESLDHLGPPRAISLGHDRRVRNDSARTPGGRGLAPDTQGGSVGRRRD